MPKTKLEEYVELLDRFMKDVTPMKGYAKRILNPGPELMLTEPRISLKPITKRHFRVWHGRGGFVPKPFSISDITSFVRIETPPPIFKPITILKNKLSELKSKKIKTNTPSSKRVKLWAKQNGFCWYCGSHVTTATCTLEHIMTKSRGGTSHANNTVMACKRCNGQKADMTLEEYRAFKGLWDSDAVIFKPTQVAWMREHGFKGEIPTFLFHGEK